MKCSCNDPNCTATIQFDMDSRMISADSNVKHEGHVSLHYDANSLVVLIHQARKALNDLAGRHDEDSG